MILTQTTTTSRILSDALAHPGLYADGFAKWCEDNIAIVRAFVAHAERVIARERTHYSARTIIEVIRHESALAESGSEAEAWKINNNRAPDLARAFMRVTGVPLFEQRRMRGVA